MNYTTLKNKRMIKQTKQMNNNCNLMNGLFYNQESSKFNIKT